MSPLEIKVRRMAAVLDASALEALANKGLVRIAQKDLERGAQVRVLGESSGELRMGVAEFEIQLPETGPAAARCTCPASGVCQHLISALLFLQKDAAGIDATMDASPTDSAGMGATSPIAEIEKELRALNAEALMRWAGKTAFAAGLKLAFEGAVEIVREGLLKIRIPHANAEVHFLPGGGLDGAIVSGEVAGAEALVVASVIGLQRALGVTWDAPPDSVGTYRVAGAPRSRREVLDACQLLLLETVAIGLSRLSHSNLARWGTLGVSAVGVHLPRLALVLRGISDEVALLLKRDARGDSGRLLGRIAHAHALCFALVQGGENPRPDLVGTHRARYTEIGNLDLVGVSAWPWRTASGHRGLTLLFWDTRARQWNSWSESRPNHQTPEFDPVKRFIQPGPWEGADSPSRLARGAFRLHHARRSGARRISGSTGSRVLMTSDARDWDRGIPVYVDWEVLEAHWTSHRSLGLKEENPLDLIVALRPTIWGRREFDAIRQSFEWVVCDSRQAEMTLTIPFSPWSESAIQLLEALRPEEMPGARVLGRLHRSNGGLLMHPYSIHWDGGRTSLLGLESSEGKSLPPPATAMGNGERLETDPLTADRVGDASGDDSDLELGDPPALELNRVLGSLFMDVGDALLAMAEGGVASHRGPHLTRLEFLAAQCGRLGLKGLEASLNQFNRNPRDPAMLLRALYALHLYRDASG